MKKLLTLIVFISMTYVVSAIDLQPIGSQDCRVTYREGVYTSDVRLMEASYNAFDGTETYNGTTTDNHCACGAVDNGNRLFPPCSCKHWKWSNGGKKWVHLGNGQGCTCTQHNHDAPINSGTTLLIIFCLCYVLFKLTKADSKLD